VTRRTAKRARQASLAPRRPTFGEPLDPVKYGEQASKAALEAGKLADMVLLDGNPLKVDKMAIKDMKVVETIKEGKAIFRK